MILCDKNLVGDYMIRCPWCESSDLYRKYHDEEWGKPVYDDRIHFEFLVLESAQSGLSWITILKKRENYRVEYDNFNPNIVALYDENKILKMLENPGIVRYRKKIESSISNAKEFLKVQKEFGSFNEYIWSFTEKKIIKNNWSSLSEVPAKTDLSDMIAKDLKKRGFKFLGSTTVYSYLQAVGIVNDHLLECQFRD
ncbi:DNA-3-methyladenine glycosylase I [Cetobacterium somerae]|uniref:DNA-3-methyladenine glycosylase I n=1 Tax=Cetobacterium sp. NK01 TaxID=2993530 RepID=UPI002116BCD5|nr:DNA-3-methyladenine glycosylase I [Cetobacterium sp. NK01]MCQ8211160.1 DNA-3-methyladenine glycosylase I [Cetobacterium sp. NK01]